MYLQVLHVDAMKVAGQTVPHRAVLEHCHESSGSGTYLWLGCLSSHPDKKASSDREVRVHSKRYCRRRIPGSW